MFSLVIAFNGAIYYTYCIMKKAIIIASFGTTYSETRSKTIDVIEKEAENKFKNIEIVTAYTSNIVRSILKKRDLISIPSAEEAASQLKQKGYTEIYIQPTHIIPGAEYDKLKIPGCILGKTLLNENADFEKFILALELPKLPCDTAILFMGHGSYHGADKFYGILEEKIKAHNYGNIFIATVEGSKTVNDILPELLKQKIKKVYLYPLMIVAGDHAQNDMAGDEEDSWKTVLQNEGYEVYPVLKGLGEYPEIRSLIFQSLENTIKENEGGK